jgi:hypothetical protein
MVRQPVLYPAIYPWFVALATFDVLLTWLIVVGFGGVELNPIAAGVISTGGMPAATFYKFATVMFVLWACEFIGRRRLLLGKRLAFYAVALNFVPVSASMAQLAAATATPL